MEERIREEFPGAAVELIPSGGGVFEVTRDGELIYSKKRTGRHAEWKDVYERLRRGS
jgi:selT/selW/selH-like putative selenoprotein